VIVDGDPERLAQMFSNLLHNAAKFTARQGRIEVVVKATSDDAFVQIRDNGIGIASENLPHVFDLYMQAGTSLQRSGSGVGIGLSLVKTIVELHGGSVRVRSEGLRQGSEFTVRIPLSAERTAPENGHVVCPSIPSMRILVVDDNHDATEALSGLLRSEGHDVHIALHGTEALEIAKVARPEVILLDLGLPSMDGFQVAEALRKTDWGRDIPLIALTGWGQPENVARTTAAGFDAHLVKPVDLQALYAKLIEVVHRSKPEVTTAREARAPETATRATAGL
jgi:CheY-like chemotaxis protein